MISIIKCQASIKQLQLPTTSGWLPVQEAQTLNWLNSLETYHAIQITNFTGTEKNKTYRQLYNEKYKYQNYFIKHVNAYYGHITVEKLQRTQ